MSKERLGGGWEFEKALFPLFPLNRSARLRVPVVQRLGERLGSTGPSGPIAWKKVITSVK